MFSTQVNGLNCHNILVEYFEYPTIIFSIFNMDDKTSLAPTADVSYRNIFTEHFGYCYKLPSSRDKLS